MLPDPNSSDDQFDGRGPTEGPDLSKRDYFAVQALQGLLAHSGPKSLNGSYHDYRLLAEVAVEAADALINKLNSPG